MKFRNFIFAFILLFSLTLLQAVSSEQDMLTPYRMEQSEILFSQSRRQVNAVNPTVYSNRAGAYFPGARGANQLILYTPEYGERTNTNEFGTEAVIEGNTVTELSGADSFIPADGAVISGHGTAKNWISANIKVGTKIYYDESTGVITTFNTSKSLVFEAMQKIEEASSMINYYKSQNPSYDWKIPTEFVKDAQNYIRKGAKNPNEIQKYSKLAIESANAAIKSVLPFKVNEFKGVWLRPTENTEAEIIAAVNKVKSAGIDNIFLETYFHGRTIFPSKTMESYGFIAQNEKFEGTDPLKIWIKEAHKRGIKVHIWFETFYVGNQVPYMNSKNILAVKPDWGNKTLAGYESATATPSSSEHNGYFLDPANPEVQEFLQRLLCEIINDYQPDGINLDYIRYPQAISSSPSGNWGYTETARSLFYQQYGVDPVSMTSSHALWVKWGDFRRRQVTNFVEKIGELGRAKNIYISAVIFPDKGVAYSRKLQDWSTWSQNHYLQAFTPLFLTCNPKTLTSQITTVINYKTPETDLIAGLFVTFMGGSEEDLIRQIHETRKVNVNGVSLFDYAHLSQNYVNALSTRVFSSNNKVNANIVKPQEPKRFNWTPPIITDTPTASNNSALVIKKFDPENDRAMQIKAPSPILSVSSRKKR